MRETMTTNPVKFHSCCHEKFIKSFMRSRLINPVVEGTYADVFAGTYVLKLDRKSSICVCAP